MTGEHTSIQSLDADDALINEFLFEAAIATPIASNGGWIPYGKSRNPYLRRLVILKIDPCITYMWRCHDDNLSVIGRISQSFLVASHTGGKNSLTKSLADGSPAFSFKYPAIIEN